MTNPYQKQYRRKRDRMPLELPTPDQDGGYFNGRCVGAVPTYLTDPETGEFVLDPEHLDPRTDKRNNRIKISERRCRTPAVQGARVCIHHGGNLSATRTKAAERIGYAVAKQAVQVKLGMVVSDKDPRQILLEQVYAAYGMVLASRALLEDVEPDDLFAGSADNGEAWVARGKMSLYSEWVDRAARISKMALDAGIDERLVKLAEQQSNLVVNILQTVIIKPELGLTAETQALFRQLIAQEFRTLALGPGGSTPAFEFAPPARVISSTPKRKGAKPFDRNYPAENGGETSAET